RPVISCYEDGLRKLKVAKCANADVEVDPVLVAAARENLATRANVTVLHEDGLERVDLVAAHTRTWLTFSVAEVPRNLHTSSNGFEFAGTTLLASADIRKAYLGE
ncbi:MAG: hypothetical protein ACYC8T_26345, partial [Myxococcaceae bacterium]